MEKESDRLKNFYSNKDAKYFSDIRTDLIHMITGKNLVILELGCGSGETLKYLKKKKIAKETVGVEIDQKAGEKAKKNVDRVFIENIEQFDLPYTKYFDYILFPDVLEHMIDPWEVLRKCKKYLKPNGHIIISIPNIRNLLTLKDFLFKGEWNYTSSGVLDKTHLRFFTWKSLRAMIEGAGYTVEIKESNNSTKPMIKLFDLLTLYQLQEIRTTQYHIKAKPNNIIMGHNGYYLDNNKYSKFLEGQDPSQFAKYIDLIGKYLPKKGFFLDVGCGTGSVLKALEKKSKYIYGVEISKTSLELCKKKELQCELYDGKTIPFKSEYFDVVGSFNVLEHTDNPITFLDENLRVLKRGGYLIIITPNFLSTTNDYHKHTKGIKQKIMNIRDMISIALSQKPRFEKMHPIIREDFHQDDDAVNVTNPLSILKWGKSHNLEKIYYSSQWLYTQGIVRYLDKPILRLFLGSACIVFKK